MREGDNRKGDEEVILLSIKKMVWERNLGMITMFKN